MLSIRSLTRQVIDVVVMFTEREGWGHMASDISRYLEWDPKGCFVAERNAQIVGHVFSTNYGKTGWIGLLIAHPNHRGQGIGTKLMTTAMNYLKDLGVETIRLEAVPEAITLYQRLGFKKEINSLRLCKQLKQEKRQIPSFKDQIRLVETEDLEEIVTFDLKYFGANRLKILKCLHEDYPEYCFVSK